MRKWAMLTGATLAILFAAGLVYACGGNRSTQQTGNQTGNQNVQRTRGKVTSISNGTITVQSGEHGGNGAGVAGQHAWKKGTNAGAQAGVAGQGTAVVVSVTGSTRVMNGNQPGSIANISVGQMVMVAYETTGGSNVAKRVRIMTGDKQAQGNAAGGRHNKQ